jgi:hypothetical protein
MAQNPFRRKGGFRLLLFIISCLAIVVIARHAFVGLLADWALHRFYPKQEGCSYGYSKAKWEGKVLSVSGIEVSMPDENLQIEKIELVLGFKPHLFIIRPQWTKKSGSESTKNQASILPLLASRFMRLDVVEGRYTLPDKQVSFSLESFESDKPNWRLSCYGKLDMSEAPFLEVFVSVHDEGAKIEIDSKAATTKELFALAEIIAPQFIQGIGKASGNWSGNFSLDLDKNWKILSLNGSACGQEFALVNLHSDWQVEAKELDLRVVSQPITDPVNWLQLLDAESAISGGSLYLKSDGKEYRFNNLAGHLCWSRETDPKFHLEGTLDLGEKTERAVLDGIGKFEEGGLFKLKTEFLFGDPRSPVVAGKVSLATEEEARLHVDVDLQRIELPLLKRLVESFGWAEQEFVPIGNGYLECKAHFLYENNVLSKVELLSSSLKDANLGGEGRIKGEKLCMTVEGKWEKTSQNDWIIRRVRTLVESGEVKFGTNKVFTFDGLSGELLIEEGQIEQSSLKANFFNIPMEIFVSGNWQRPALRAFAAGTLDSLANILKFAGMEAQNQVFGSDSIELSCECKPQELGYAVGAQILVGNDAKIETQFYWSDEKVQRGAFSAMNLPLGPFASRMSKGATAKGFVNAEGKFDYRGGNIAFSLSEVTFMNEAWAFTLPSGQRGKLHWGSESQETRLELALQSAEWTLKGPEKTFKNLQGLLIASNQSVEVKNISTEIEGIHFKGDVELKEGAVTILAQEVYGDLSDLRKCFNKEPTYLKLPEGIEGKFHIKDRDLAINWPSNTFYVRASVTRAFIPFMNIGALERFSTQIAYDSKEGIFTMASCSGDIRLGKGMPMQLETVASKLSCSKSEISGPIEGFIKYDGAALLHCLGTLRIMPQKGLVEFIPEGSKALGTYVEKGFLQLSDDTCRFSFSGKGSFNEVATCAESLKQNGFLDTSWLPKSLQGDFTYQIAWDQSEARWDGHLKSEEISITGKKANGLFVHLNKEAERIRIEEARWDDCKLFAEIALLNKAPVFRYNFANKTLFCTGDGAIDFTKHKIQVAPIMEFSWLGQRFHLKPKGRFDIKWDNLGLVTMDSCKWEEPATRSSFEFAKMQWNYLEGRMEVDGGSFKVSSALAARIWPSLQIRSDWFEGTAKYLKNSSGFEITGTLNDGEYGWEGFSKQWRALQWRCTPGNILIGGKTKIGDAETTGTLQVESTSNLGLLKVQKTGSESSLSLLFRLKEHSLPLIQRFSGESFGIKADLKNVGNGKNLLSGTLDFDFAQLHEVFPPNAKAMLEKLKLGKGFGFDGEISFSTLKDWSAKGKIKGKDCIVFGVALNNLDTQVLFTPHNVQFKNITVNDKAINAAIPRFSFEESKEGVWSVQCPMLQVKDLKPSVLKGEKEKPFVIRNLTISDVQGELGHLEDLKGKCALHFTNAWKKETTALDIPLNILKDLGLEPSLFVPVQGEFIGHFEQGKLRFTELKGAYSDERRTRFAISEKGEGSYIDFDGKLHIDLVMRQSVVLKLGESVILGIRGNLQKPRYVLIP